MKTKLVETYMIILLDGSSSKNLVLTKKHRSVKCSSSEPHVFSNSDYPSSFLPSLMSLTKKMMRVKVTVRR